MNGWPPGISLLRFDELNSTNEEARRRAREGETGPLWILSKRQTKGRGRRGRTWETLDGNLAATLLLRLEAPPQMAAQLSFAAALAVAEAAAYFAPAAAISVKWPNDVLADDRKLSGILLEAGTGWLAIGVGINLAQFPSGAEFPAISLAALGLMPPTPEEALAVVARRFAHWYLLWEAQGFAPLREAWLRRADGLGRIMRARLPHEERHGSFAGIDANGALLLDERGHVRVITAGEVFFG